MRFAKCAFLEHQGPIPVAHRGGMGEGYPFAASTLERALALGCYIELDITATADGVAVVWHPLGINRLRSRHSLNLDAAHLHVAGLTSSERDDTSVVHRLDDVLGSYPNMHAMIDVKTWSAVEPVAKAIATTNSVLRVSIGTFSQRRTDATAHRILDLTGKNVCTAIGPARILSLAARSLLPAQRPRKSNANSVQPPYHLVTKRIVELAHEAGLAVIPWTVNRPQDILDQLKLEVDGLITDYPSRLIHIIQDTGLDKPSSAFDAC